MYTGDRGIYGYDISMDRDVKSVNVDTDTKFHTHGKPVYIATTHTRLPSVGFRS